MIDTEFRFNIAAIAELVEPMEVLLCKLDDNLQAQVYGAIVSEGASACIPGSIMQKAINMVYCKQGFDEIPVLHLGRHRCPEDFTRIRKILENNPECINLLGSDKKALLVTEHISSGRRLEEAGLLLHEFGVQFDVAALFATQYKDWYKDVIRCFREEGIELFVGYKYSTGVLLRCDLSGRIPAPSISHNDRLNIKVWSVLEETKCIEDKEITRLAPLVKEDIDKVAKQIIKKLDIARDGVLT